MLTAAALFCFALLALALLLQHRFNMQPCSWCVLQRLVYLATGGACALAAWSPGGRWVRTAGALLAGLLSIGGLAAALQQHFVAARSSSCAMTLADRIVMQLSLHELAPWMFMPTAPCSEANLPLAGVPFALWSAAAFLLLAAACAWVLWSVAARRRRV